MTNDTERERRQQVLHRFWDLDFRIGSAIFYAPPAWLFFLVFFSGQGGERFLAWMPIAWTAVYAVVALGVAWQAYFADDMPFSRSLSTLVAGAAPGALFIPGSPLTEKPLVWIALPALIAWGVVGQYFAYHPLPTNGRTRRVLFLSAALGCLAGAVGAALFTAILWDTRNGPSLGDGIWLAIFGAVIGGCLIQAALFLRRLRIK